jgi:P-type E1-E2 ATPase
MIYQVTGVGEIELNTIVLDLNGTLQVQDEIVAGAKERLAKLRELGYKIYLFTGDQRGNAAEVCADLGIDYKVTKSTEEKAQGMQEFNKENTVAIGNARIDIGMFENAKVRIATLQAEGIHAGILGHVDVITNSINDALDLLIDPNTFAATMRL